MTALCNTSNLKSSIGSDIFVEMLFILDIIFNFRMTFVSEKGEVVEAGKDIALHYIKGGFQSPTNPISKGGSSRTWSQLFLLTCSMQPALSTTW